MRRLSVTTLLSLALVLAAAPASAGAGLHGGMSLSPDNFLVGLHFESTPMAENLRLVPSVEVGFGDVTMVGGNLDLHYPLKTKSELAPYLGAGMTVNWFDHDSGSQTDIGGSVLGGISLNRKIFLEAKLGLGDVPDWKFYVGARVP